MLSFRNKFDLTEQRTPSPSLQGIGFLILALFLLSLQDVAVKWISGNYPVLEIVLFRNLVALPGTLLLFRLEGNRSWPTTNQHKLEYVRGFLLFFSFTTYMMGIAALPLAEVSAIRNSAPLMITLFSVVLLGEFVGLRRWAALGVGFVGVLLIVRPGGNSFNLGSVFVLLATLSYALNVMITRQLGKTDSGATMAYYSTLVYLALSCALAPIVAVSGETPDAHPSIAFLFHPWILPSLLDGAIMAGLGMIWAVGMYLIARAYSLAKASVVAPFEYAPLLYNVMWGFVLWHEIPTSMTLVGATLTVASGLYLLYRTRRES